MSNFEKIDDYLMNRLSDVEKLAFEQEVASDPSLQTDIELQKNILEGIKKARATELKTMLNNVPLTGLQGGFTAGKIAATIATVGLISAGLYLYFSTDETGEKVLPSAKEVLSENKQPENANPNPEKITPVEEAKKENKKEVADETKKEASPNKPKKDEAKVVANENKPKIEVVDPTEDLPLDNEAREAKTEVTKSGVFASHIAVETDSSSKKYNFHYQFNDGRLMLFGSFDKTLYEILEISGDSHAVFLFYKQNYYLLDEAQHKITPLNPIKDSELLKKLKEYQRQ